METFTKLKELVENRNYQIQRQETLHALTDEMIDVPIINLVNSFNKLPYCFTLQSCYGHFVYNGQKDSRNVEPLPRRDTNSVVQNGFGKGMPILMHCRWNPTGSSVRIRQLLILMKRCILKKQEMNFLLGCIDYLKTCKYGCPNGVCR